MELKHTIEILTKDIQEIENLVANLNNYPSPPQIEIDLALSKLRNVYDLLYTISIDRKTDQADLRIVSKESPKSSPETPNTEVVLEPADDKKASTQETIQVEAVPEVEPVKNPVIETPDQEPPIQTVVAETAVPEPVIPEPVVPEPVVQEEVAPAPAAAPVEKNIESKAITQVSKPIESGATKPKAKEAEIIAEKYGQDVSLNDRIAGDSHEDISNKLSGEHIDSIKRNIGINDRFLIIRELLDGDNEAYNKLLQHLDSSENFNDAFKIMEERFPDRLEHEGVKMLTSLARRKFIN